MDRSRFADSPDRPSNLQLSQVEHLTNDSNPGYAVNRKKRPNTVVLLVYTAPSPQVVFIDLESDVGKFRSR